MLKIYLPQALKTTEERIFRAVAACKQALDEAEKENDEDNVVQLSKE